MIARKANAECVLEGCGVCIGQLEFMAVFESEVLGRGLQSPRAREAGVVRVNVVRIARQLPVRCESPAALLFVQNWG